jgi:hypothetical protein
MLSVRNEFAACGLSPEDKSSDMEIEMSVKGQIKEAAGFAKEEAYEHGKSASSQQKAQEGRNLRNEGRVEMARRQRPPSPEHRNNLFWSKTVL